LKFSDPRIFPEKGARKMITRHKIASAACALTIAASILLGTHLTAAWITNSRIYLNSMLLVSITDRDEGVSMFRVITDTEKRDMTARFIGALTNAYLRFELLPHTEAQTFAAVFQSLGEGIHISEFEYKRHDLLIRGNADTAEAYEAFLRQLSETGHFASVSGHTRPAYGGGVVFEIWCASQNPPAALI
jgi:hypothetical protein